MICRRIPTPRRRDRNFRRIVVGFIAGVKHTVMLLLLGITNQTINFSQIGMGSYILGIDIKQPTLEDVFLYVTGTSLGSDTAENKPEVQ